MEDLFLLGEKIERKNERFGRFKKFKKALIEKIERDEKKKSDELAKLD